MVTVEGNTTANQALWSRALQTVLSKLTIVHRECFISSVDSLVCPLMHLLIQSINSASMEREVIHTRACVCVF